MDSTIIHPRIDLIFIASHRAEIDDPTLVFDDWGLDIWVDVNLGDD